jgi:hypothetical protein
MPPTLEPPSTRYRPLVGEGTVEPATFTFYEGTKPFKTVGRFLTASILLGGRVSILILAVFPVEGPPSKLTQTSQQVATPA